MNSRNLFPLAIVAFVLLVLAMNTFYVLKQTEQAIVLNLGNPVRVVNSTAGERAGLQMKWPFVERVIKFDKRVLQIEPQEAEITGRDQNKLVVDAFVRYRITQPLRFYQSLRSTQTAEDRLRSMVSSALREQLGTVTVDEIISGRRAELMTRTRDEVSKRAQASGFGVQIIDLRIRRADYPEANQQAVFDRMRSARNQQAATYRAEGQQQRLEILGAASKEGEQIRGEADAQRAKLFADSFGQDPSFAAFYRSMAAYEASIGPDSTLVLSPDSDFFKYFRYGPTGGGK